MESEADGSTPVVSRYVPSGSRLPLTRRTHPSSRVQPYAKPLASFAPSATSSVVIEAPTPGAVADLVGSAGLVPPGQPFIAAASAVIVLAAVHLVGGRLRWLNVIPAAGSSRYRAEHRSRAWSSTSCRNSSVRTTGGLQAPGSVRTTFIRWRSSASSRTRDWNDSSGGGGTATGPGGRRLGSPGSTSGRSRSTTRRSAISSFTGWNRPSARWSASRSPWRCTSS